MIKFLSFLLIFTSFSFSNNIKYIQIFKAASKASKYEIPKDLLIAIALSENSTFNKNTKVRNVNRTLDIGIMQINDIVRKEFNMSRKDMLNPHKNIFTATAHLKRFLSKKNGGLNWFNIGKYHSKTPTYKLAWVKRVKSKLSSLNPYLKIPGYSRCVTSAKKYKAKRFN